MPGWAGTQDSNLLFWEHWGTVSVNPIHWGYEELLAIIVSAQEEPYCWCCWLSLLTEVPVDYCLKGALKNQAEADDKWPVCLPARYWQSLSAVVIPLMIASFRCSKYLLGSSCPSLPCHWQGSLFSKWRQQIWLSKSDHGIGWRVVAPIVTINFHELASEMLLAILIWTLTYGLLCSYLLVYLLLTSCWQCFPAACLP